MSATAFGSSPAHAFIESPAGARDDPVESVSPWSIATIAFASYFQWGWDAFNKQLLNEFSFSARDKYLKQRRLVTTFDGETWDQTFTADRVTGKITESPPVFSPGWVGVFSGDKFFTTEDSTATHLLLNAHDGDNNVQFSVEIFNATPNPFGLSAIRCAALLDQVNLDEYDVGDRVDIFYQMNPDLPNPGTIVTRVTPRADVGEFPYVAFHDLAEEMAYYRYQPGDDAFNGLPPENYFTDLGLGEFGLEQVSDSVYMQKCKVLMHGDLCRTIRRRKFTDGGLGENFEDEIKCVPFASFEPFANDESTEVRFDPPCRQGYYHWFADAWIKHFTEVDGEQTVIADYPTHCDLLEESGSDPNCFTNPT